VLGSGCWGSGPRTSRCGSAAAVEGGATVGRRCTVAVGARLSAIVLLCSLAAPFASQSGRVELRAKAQHRPKVGADDGGASGHRSLSCLRRCGVSISTDEGLQDLQVKT
jgi:hypothetical protein